MYKLIAPLPFALLLAACAPNASGQETLPNIGHVRYYGFEVQRITGLHEEEMEKYGCSFKITREAFDRVLLNKGDSPRYNSKDVRVKIVFGPETIFIDRLGVGQWAGGREFLVDTKQFAASLVATGPCPEVP